LITAGADLTRLPGFTGPPRRARWRPGCWRPGGVPVSHTGSWTGCASLRRPWRCGADQTAWWGP